MKVYNKKSEKPMCLKLKNEIEKIRKEKNFKVEEYVLKKAELLNRYMKKYNLKACVVAVSGGIDSAVVLAIVNYAYRMVDSPIEKVIPLLLPIMNSTGVTNQDEATNRGLELCEVLGLKPYIVDLTRINNVIREDLEKVVGIIGEDWAIGQLGPYSRTPILYYTTSLLSQIDYPAIICGTTNMDEGTYLGYIGKASDGMVDVQIISDIHKSEVYQVGEYLNIPKSIMEVTPSGDMYDSRDDETVFGASYDFVELYLNYLNWNKEKQQEFLLSLKEEEREQFDFYARNLEKLHNYNLHKYVGASPAIHLDLWDSSVKNGWEGYYDKLQKIMK